MKLQAPGVRGALQILDRTIDFMLRRNDSSRRRHVSRVNPLLDTLVNHQSGPFLLCSLEGTEAARLGLTTRLALDIMSLFGDKPEEEEEGWGVFDETPAD